MNGRNLIEVVNAFERKYNPSESPSGHRVAMVELRKTIKEAIEKKKLNRERVDFKRLYQTLVEDKPLIEGNVSSSAFPSIAGEIISSAMIEGYKAYPVNIENLVKTVPSKLKVSRVVGWTAIGSIVPLNERQPYPEINEPEAKEKTIRNKKHGGLLSLTKEAIFFDQTGDLVNRAREIGAEAERKRQEIILKKIIDADSDALSGSALYSAGNSNLITTNALDTDGWEAVHKNLLTKTDDSGESKPIWVFQGKPIMMVGANLWATATKLATNEFGPQGTGNLDKNLAKGMFDVMVNPYVATPLTNTTWHYGWFKAQMRWEEVWPTEFFERVGQSHEDGFKEDVIQQFKVSWYGGAGAVDTRYVFENTV